MAMQELIEYVAQSLVTQPDQVQVVAAEEDGVLVYKLRVAPEDVGKVIGRQGRIANALRTLLKVSSIREGRRAILEIL